MNSTESILRLDGLSEQAAACQSAETQPIPPPMLLALCASFGSESGWRADVLAGAATGAAWLLMRFDAAQGRLVLQTLAADAHSAEPALLVLKLVPDMSGALAHIAWDRVYAAYQEAVHAASEGLGVSADELGQALLLDVRRAGVFENATATLPGASWRDPAQVGRWAAELPLTREVIVYCIYGHEVGRATALRLRAAGISARYLHGGIDAWTIAGRPLQARGEQP